MKAMTYLEEDRDRLRQLAKQLERSDEDLKGQLAVNARQRSEIAGRLQDVEAAVGELNGADKAG